VGTIYVVATPIGNLEDITLRAVRILGEVDVVAAEDTRRTRILLSHLGIRKRVISYHDAVEAARAPELVGRALAGESIALVSDAGTPLVADPGYRLVTAAVESGVPVVPIPGPSAPLALLSCAGLPTQRFTFAGFLPSRASARRRFVADLRDLRETLVLFETAKRLPGSLADLAEILGPRPVAIGRELTKRFEEIVRGDLRELAERFGDTEAAARLRGEIVLAIRGRDDDSAAPADEADLESRILAHVRARLDQGEAPSQAAKHVAAELGVPRNEVYRHALAARTERAARELHSDAEPD